MKAEARRRISLIGAFEELPARMGRLDMRDLPMAVQYFIALALVAAAISARLLLDPYLQDRVPYLLVFGVLLVLVVAVCPGPFFVAAIVGGIGTWYYVVPPRDTFVLETTFLPSRWGSTSLRWRARQLQRCCRRAGTSAKGGCWRRLPSSAKRCESR